MKKVQVHLYNTNSVSLDYLYKNPLLNEEDIEVIKKYKMEESKKEKAASFIFKRKYVGDFYLNEQGKPLNKNKYFNIAHSKGVVVYVEDSDHLIGIDIEKNREVDESLKRYISSDEEYNYIKDSKSFFEVWTNKESLVKAIGIGINSKVNKIPALPINGNKMFNYKSFYSKVIFYEEYVISVCIENEEDFEIEINEEKL